MSEGMEAARRRADKQRYAWPSEVPTEEECEAAARHSRKGGRPPGSTKTAEEQR